MILHRLSLILMMSSALTACGNTPNPESSQSATLRIGEAIQFSTGKITKQQSEGDMVFQYQPPQSPHGWRYNPTTGQVEYQAQVMTNENYPLLSASKTGAFKTKPDFGKLTAGDINQWTEVEYDIGPGRFIVVRGYSDKKHWLVKITSFNAKSNDPKSWLLSFTYEPLNIAVGAAGTAGQQFPLTGSFSFRERLISEKIVSLNLSDGKLKTIFDGYGVSRNANGEYAYINTALQIVIADKLGKQISVFEAPQSASTENRIGGSGSMEAIISPNGRSIAVGGITRRVTHTDAGVSIPSVPMAAVAIMDRNGKEITSFTSANFPTWTSTGRLMMADPDEAGIFITDASLKNLKKVPNVPAGTILGISMTSDEKTIAFSLNHRIWLINTDGTGLRQLTQSGLSEVTPEWSPDNQFIALQQSIPGKKEFYQVIVMRIKDGKTVVITDDAGANREPLGRINWTRE